MDEDEDGSSKGFTNQLAQRKLVGFACGVQFELAIRVKMESSRGYRRERPSLD